MSMKIVFELKIFDFKASLNSGINLRQVVKLPKGEDFNDWLAVHVVDFFNRINLIYGTVCEQVRIEM